MTRIKKLTLLSALYLAQGLPYGFFTQALPVLLRESNLSLPQIGLANLLTLPWALKFIWAPSVDRYHFKNVGLRKSWLLPLQLVSIALYVALGFATLGASELSLVLAAFLFTNLLAASQDIATDGLAVDILKPEERGWGNGIQVAGYRIGMIIGGGALLALYPFIGWSGVMLSMAGFAALCTIPVVRYREPLASEKPPRSGTAFKEMIHFYLAPGALLWFLVLLFYKFGHASATGMLRPWLVDQGYSIVDIAWILGTGGFVAGFVGAMSGGWLAARFSRPKLLIWLGAVQMASVASYLWPVMTEHAAYKVWVSASLDHFTSGLATTTLFTLMMDACSKERAASDYTAQACAIVVSQGLAMSLSGFSADRLGYTMHFMLSTVIGALAVILTYFVIRNLNVRKLLKPTAAVASLGAVVLTLTFAGALVSTPTAWAQDSSSTNAPYEIGAQVGALLPGRKVRFVRDIMQGPTFRATRPFSDSSAMEVSIFASNAHGDKYSTLSAEYRAVIWNDIFPAHVSIGLHGDYISPGGRPSRSTIGWQFGGGMRQPLGESGIAVREDFSYRQGGGTSLLVMLGLSYDLPTSGSN